MDLSAVIFVLLAVAWAVYLIPRALRHHDEAARTRSIETFSGSTRVLARSEPAEDRDTRLVVTPARQASRSVEPPSRSAEPPSRSVEPPSRSVEPPSRLAEPVETPRRASSSPARAAARRRRRILVFLMLCVLGTTAAAALAYLPWWSVAAPGGLTLAFLVLCRTQVRRDLRSVPVHDRAAAAPLAAASAPVPAAAPAEPVDLPSVQVDERSDVPFDAEALVEPPAPVTDASGSIWDPLPVTLPTYVTAPKAHRTVRTIDLGEPGTWTSGRTVEDAEIAVQAAQPEAPEGTGRRAVGS